ncbi:MAG: divergent polysaccharide deacetylase family protein [Campylobacteraceae bacterium]|nr:divergent polysaccharide deacetylase family protein [Campylobacteraceae bacterium]
MSKKIKEKKEKQSLSHSEPSGMNFRKYGLIFLILVLVPIAVTSIYIYIDAYQQNLKVIQKQQTTSDELMQKMKQMLEDEKLRLASLPPVPKVEENETQVLQDTLKTDGNESNISKESLVSETDTKAHEVSSEIKDYANSLKEVKEPSHKVTEVIRKKYPQGTTPKLAIIIDDVSFPWQTRMMKEIPYKVTPAFFPPTSGHPETVRLSHEFEFAMIHLPMESKNYAHPEPDTLTTVDSQEVIANRIARIKKWFPHIKYYNNHTGGSFTAHYAAMDKLIGVMQDESLIFVDSRTVGNSKAPEIFKKYNIQLLSRDVFLDNSLNKSEIREQLRKAVVVAKKHGYAIAIGHPHKSTLEVLRDSRDLLEGIDLVYVKDL